MTLTRHEKFPVIQQIIWGGGNTFHHACIESCESYKLTQKNCIGMLNCFNWPSPQPLKMPRVKISVKGSWLLCRANASPHVRGKILDESCDWLSRNLPGTFISNYSSLQMIKCIIGVVALQINDIISLPEKLSAKDIVPLTPQKSIAFLQFLQYFH